MFLFLVEVKLDVNGILRGAAALAVAGTQMLLVFLSIMSGLWEPFTTPPGQDWSVLSFPLSLNIVQHACDPQSVP